ncbi:BCCT family transporter, partial [Microvirga sp. 3-52]|nr:BCCT family transporter [Microvirga sp. 3-52]
MKPKKSTTDWPVLIISGGLLLVFVLASLINTEFVTNAVNVSFAVAIKYFGAFWQVVLLGTFFVAIGIAISSYGKVRLGMIDKPQIGKFKWIAMIMTTLLAGGGVFWAAAEPMHHFISTPPTFDGIQSSTIDAIIPALAQSYLHWGFLAWAILGTLSTIVLMYAHYHRGMPLKPRSLLYPIFGEKIMKN